MTSLSYIYLSSNALDFLQESPQELKCSSNNTDVPNIRAEGFQYSKICISIDIIYKSDGCEEINRH